MNCGNCNIYGYLARTILKNYQLKITTLSVSFTVNRKSTNFWYNYRVCDFGLIITWQTTKDCQNK